MSKVLFCFPPLDDGPAIKGTAGDAAVPIESRIIYTYFYANRFLPSDVKCPVECVVVRIPSSPVHQVCVGGVLRLYVSQPVPEVEGIQDPEEVG